MSGSTAVGAVRAGWSRFLERLGLYLLVGPVVAWLTLHLIAGLIGRSPGMSWDGSLLFLLMLYLAALPVAGLYAGLIALVLALGRDVAFFHVVLCALVVGLALYGPMLALGAPSDGGAVAAGDYLVMLAVSVVPVLASGTACWLIAPSLHRRPK